MTKKIFMSNLKMRHDLECYKRMADRVYMLLKQTKKVTKSTIYSLRITCSQTVRRASHLASKWHSDEVRWRIEDYLQAYGIRFTCLTCHGTGHSHEQNEYSICLSCEGTGRNIKDIP